MYERNNKPEPLTGILSGQFNLIENVRNQRKNQANQSRTSRIG